MSEVSMWYGKIVSKPINHYCICKNTYDERGFSLDYPTVVDSYRSETVAKAKCEEYQKDDPFEVSRTSYWVYLITSTDISCGLYRNWHWWESE